MAKDNLCAIDVFKETWKLLNNCKDLNEAKRKFRVLVADLILKEVEN